MNGEEPREFIGNGRFALDRLLGSGGSGSVFLAFDTALGRWVAVKRMNAAGAGALAGARAIAGICHPNIVMVHDILEEGDGILLVMEFIPGPNLGELPGPMDVESFRVLAAQCLEALAEAHGHGVLHGDIKPGNIMLAPQDGGGFQAKLLDFGQSRPMGRPSVQTIGAHGAPMGSAHTMSPEQLGGGELDLRTDLYSLGLVFYQALSGGKPLAGEGGNAVCAAHPQHPHRPLRGLRPDLPEALAAWVERLFAFDRNSRPSSAGEALAELAAACGQTQEPGGDIPVVQALPVARAVGARRVRLLEAQALKTTAPVSAAGSTGSPGAPPFVAAVKPVALSASNPQPAAPRMAAPAFGPAAPAEPNGRGDPPRGNGFAPSRRQLAWLAAALVALLGGAFAAARYTAGAPASSFGARGGSEKILQAKFYDLKQTGAGQPSKPLSDPEFFETVKQFVGANNWDPSFLSKYYCAPAPLSSPRLYVPMDGSAEGPKAFGVEGKAAPFYWLVHYKGKFRALKDGVFRFVGCGDNVLVVRLDQKNVLDGSGHAGFHLDASYNSNPPELLGPACSAGWQLKAGQWFQAKKGQGFDIEIAIGDAGGGAFSAYLFYEEKGAVYPGRPDGAGFAYPLFELDGSAMPPVSKPSPYNPPIHAAAERVFEGAKP